MKKLALLVATAAAVLSTPALAAHVCIRHDDIRNWSSPNDRTVVLENYRHQKARLKLIGTCGNLKFSETLEIRSHGLTGLSCVEPGDIVVTRDSGLGGRCAIVSVEPYTGTIGRHDHDSDDADHDHDGDHDSDHGHHDTHGSY